MVDGWTTSWMKNWLDGWSTRVMLMHHTLLGCLWQLEDNRSLSWDLSYLTALLSVFLSPLQVTPNWEDQLICLSAEQPSRGTHRGQWIRLRGTPWNSTRTNTKCCPGEGRAFGLTWAGAGGAGEQLHGKVPGVVVGSELNINMNYSLGYSEYAEPLPNT